MISILYIYIYYIYRFLSKLLLRNRKLVQKYFDGRLFLNFDIQINYITHFTTLKVKYLSQLSKCVQTCITCSSNESTDKNFEL